MVRRQLLALMALQEVRLWLVVAGMQDGEGFGAMGLAFAKGGWLLNSCTTCSQHDVADAHTG